MNKIKIFILLVFTVLCITVLPAFSSIRNKDNLIIDKNVSNQTYSESGSVAANITTMSSKIPTITVTNKVTLSNNTTYVSGTILNSEDGILKIGQEIKFLSNTAFESGGAIYNLNLTSVTIIGQGSNFSSNTATNAGGAIYSIGNLQIGNNVEFYGNKYTSTTAIIDGKTIYGYGENILTGGAIYQNGNSGNDDRKQKWILIGTDVEFSSNSAYKGGAMYVILSSVTVSSNVAFKNNSANRNGGAVYVFKTTFTIEDGANFSSNIATNKGGAIYAFDSILNLNAISKKIEFSGNSVTSGKGDAIYSVNGEINLVANGANVFFKKGNSIVSTGTTVMSIETSTSNYVDFNSEIDMEGGTINFNSGEIRVSSNCYSFNVGTLNLSSGTLNLSTGTFNLSSETFNSVQNIVVDTFTSTKNVNLSIDITVDSITINDNFSISKKASGVINLTKINISSIAYSTGSIDLFTGNGNLEDLRIKISTKPVYYSTYTFFNSPILGKLDYSIESEIKTVANLETFLNSEHTNAAKMTISTTSSKGANINNHLAIYGNSYRLTNSNAEGITISSLGALTLVGNSSKYKINSKFTNNNYLYAENVNFQTKNIYNLCNIVMSSSSIESPSSASTVRFIAYDVSFSSVSLINNSSVTIKNTDKAEKSDFIVNVKLNSVSFSTTSTSTSSISSAIKSDTYIKVDSVTNSNINSKIICSIDSATFINNKSTDGGAIYSGISGIDVVDTSTSSVIAIVINSNIEYKMGDNINFSSNSAGTFGGAIYSDNSMSSYTIKNLLEVSRSSFTSKMLYSMGNNVVFSSNSAQYGGAIVNYVEQSSKSVVFNTEFTIGANVLFSSNSADIGGAVVNVNGEISFNDGATFSFNTATNLGGAIYNSSGTINLTAKEHDIIFNGNKGTGGAIYNSGGTINLNVYKNQKIEFKTLSDTIVSVDTTSVSSVLNINTDVNKESAGTIIINSDMSGFKGTANINSGIFKLSNSGKFFGGTNIIENAVFDFSSDGKRIKNYDISNFKINGRLDLIVDVNLKEKKMDTIYSSSNSMGSGDIYIKEFNLVTITSEKSVDILFTSSTALKGKVSSVSKIATTTATSPEYIYDVSYDKNTGYFSFISRDVANPTTLEGTVAMLAGSLATQENVLNQAFVSMNTSFTNRHDRRMDLLENSKNLYASTENFIFFEQNKIEGGLWLRPYAYQEKLTIASYDVDNTVYGALAGLDLKITDDKLLSFYIGYTGVNQKFENIKVDQNGYVFGVTGMLVKEKFYLGLTANAGVTDTKAESAKGTDDFQINTYIVGLKGGYEFKAGNYWIIEPNLSLIYGFYGVENYTTKQGAKVAEDSINNFRIEPQIKAKLDLVDGWKPYALLGYIYNTGKTSTQVNGNNKKEEGIDPYYEYGIGLEKNFIGTAWVGYAQVTGKSGGKQGVGVNLGIKYAF
ncbi:autotransporter domain-containing protein [Candidatus Ruminimicrobium bovinum]|uniref:autotransporter domain-containing protein n=1 Tax=Candidatus Ruminimicrobium bovinum TaxID=3242779 RepID=UPI0039B97133